MSLTDANVPCPAARYIAGYEEIWYQRMKQKDPSPDIECIVSVVREQERMVNPAR